MKIEGKRKDGRICSSSVFERGKRGEKTGGGENEREWRHTKGNANYLDASVPSVGLSVIFIH